MTETKQPGALERDRAGSALLGSTDRISTVSSAAAQAHCQASLWIQARILPDGDAFTLSGRDAWALRELIKAGPCGVTPIDNPGPRWSGYIFKLRRKHGLGIETVYEPHGGDFPGNHARYILRSAVEVLKGALRHDPQA